MYGYLGSTDAQHLARMKQYRDSFDLVLTRLKAQPSFCTHQAFNDATTLYAYSQIMLAHAASGAENADKAYVQAQIVDAENVANGYLRKVGACFDVKPPQVPTSASDYVAAASNLPMSSKVILGGLAAVLGLGALKAIF